MFNSQIRLNQTQLDDMTTHGFVVLKDLFTHEEIEQLEVNLATFHLRHEAVLQASTGSAGISRAGEILFSDHIAEQDEDVKEFTCHEKLIALTTQLLGEDVDLYWNQTVYKNPETSKEFPWHQDDAYTPVIQSPYLTCWLAISDATTENGCISVLPGSHTDGLRPHENTPIGLVGHSADHPDQGIQVPVSKGSMILFWSTVLHKSGPNLSNEMRKAYVIQYSVKGIQKVGESTPIPNLIPVARRGGRAES
jgi:phytanoyl-CoA hydroxylase